jgi:hypothetical protein
MTKRQGAQGAPNKAGKAGSAENAGPARPWTDEEMAEAKPLPLPTVDPTAKDRTPRGSLRRKRRDKTSWAPRGRRKAVN